MTTHLRNQFPSWLIWTVFKGTQLPLIVQNLFASPTADPEQAEYSKSPVAEFNGCSSMDFDPNLLRSRFFIGSVTWYTLRALYGLQRVVPGHHRVESFRHNAS